eukprot:TRINITY_DN9476_c1_g1_i1.p3 TRINITY_DN9476_c1_g1~~TRINITY_DN9476_c1_g1_i1.p3  ORF type:complete len:108 (+),score=5.88 TRINITY_DN9476_c1_g1_i1:42-365(+)
MAQMWGGNNSWMCFKVRVCVYMYACINQTIWGKNTGGKFFYFLGYVKSRFFSCYYKQLISQFVVLRGEPKFTKNLRVNTVEPLCKGSICGQKIYPLYEEAIPLQRVS